ncbi:ribulose-phosphate 3-epimerase [Buchnera aphidicola]|uniref:ribulose-phosphate 3-epimerase n=1 Tax=Buchnera aphidicola TaxID=9 RepID=UPI00346466B2
MKKFFISPSILSADFSRLGQDVQNVLDAGSDMIHFDVMDNHYVPNLTFGPMILKSLRSYPIRAPIDVHLMTSSVDALIPIFAKSGADYITFHPDSTRDIHHTIRIIKQNNCKSGIAINPDVSIKILDPFLEKLDLILLMSVYPGFSGQKFILSVLKKIRSLRKYLNFNFPNILLQVDGGININNIFDVAEAGADIFVMGSAIFCSNNYYETIQNLKKKIILVSS